MERLILFADDSPTVLRRAERILLDEGFAVATVSNGVAAINKLPKLRPSLVLADVSMPGKDGYEVCDFVKRSADFCNVPVLLVASDLEPYDEARGGRVRADGIVKKPFTPYDLTAIVMKFAGSLAPLAIPPEAPRREPVAPSVDQSVPAPPAAPAPETVSASPEPQPVAAVVPLPEPPAAPAPETVSASPEPQPVAAPAPLPEPPAAPAPETVSASPEPQLEAAPAPLPEPLQAAPEAVSEPAVQPAPEPIPPSLESAPQAAPAPEPPQAPLGPIPHFVAEAAPELALVSSELIAATETVERTGEARELPLESAAPAPALSETETVEPLVAPTPEPTPETSAVRAEEPALPTQASEAAAGQEEPVPPAREWIEVVVRKTVAKMVPPILPAFLIGQIVLSLTDQIADELAAHENSPSAL